jgi:MFS family permease
MTPDVAIGSWIDSDVPPRLDALRWSAWHRRVVFALGITWILDGLEASLVANIAPTLQDPHTLGLTATEVGWTNASYLTGEVIGALGFAHLTDLYGRRRLFVVTLAIYLLGTAATGLAPNFTIFLALRFIAGAGIGGECAAINSAIDELVPARVRGALDLGINGSYWIGVAVGAVATLVVLDPRLLSIDVGWRLSFGLGAALGAVVLLVRRNLPESPRWLLLHGYAARARQTVGDIERAAGQAAANVAPVRVHVSGAVGLAALGRALLVRYRRRTVLGVVLMVSQAVLYNAVFFSYALVLRSFFGVAAAHVSLYLVPVAIGNFLGPLVLGPLFDRVGRRVMIPATYAVSGVLLAITAALFGADALDAMTQTIAWSVVLFVASAAASSAYLTVSELFPVELRARAIAVFYAIGTLAGACAPVVMGALIDTGDPDDLVAGYAVASLLMIAAAVVGRRLGVAAEGRSLEALRD